MFIWLICLQINKRNTKNSNSVVAGSQHQIITLAQISRNWDYSPLSKSWNTGNIASRSLASVRDIEPELILPDPEAIFWIRISPNTL